MEGAMGERRIVVALTDTENDFQRLQAADAKAVAAASGVEIDVVVGSGYAIEQIHQIFGFIHKRADQRPAAIVAEPVSEDGLERLARNALRAGIGWVSLNQRSHWLADLRREFPNLPVASVGTDQVAVGRIQAAQARALLPDGGRAFCITGPSQHAATGDRRRGWERGLTGSSVEFSYAEGQWTHESGVRLMRNWTRLRSGGDPGFDLVACQNDDMAAGARAVLEDLARDPGRAHWAQVPCLGVDGLASGGQAMVDRGELAATIVNPSNSGPAVAMLARWLRTGESIEPELLLSPTPYTARVESAGRPILRPSLSRPWELAARASVLSGGRSLTSALWAAGLSAERQPR
jgi:ABC-type sugar transport system substrate-binding protein